MVGAVVASVSFSHNHEKSISHFLPSQLALLQLTTAIIGDDEVLPMSASSLNISLVIPAVG